MAYGQLNWQGQHWQGQSTGVDPRPKKPFPQPNPLYVSLWHSMEWASRTKVSNQNPFKRTADNLVLNNYKNFNQTQHMQGLRDNREVMGPWKRKKTAMKGLKKTTTWAGNTGFECQCARLSFYECFY